jgi:nuclear GTP-binding protein
MKGGEPCLRTAAIMMINDFQRGKLPHYVAPLELKEDEKVPATSETAKIEGVTLEVQNLDSVQRGTDLEDEDKGDNAAEGASESNEDIDEEGENGSNDEESVIEGAGGIMLVGAGDWD